MVISYRSLPHAGKACMEAASPPFFIGTMPESAFLVTSHSYDTREGIVSHAWHEILRLSPHLFWLGLFTHRAFSLRSGCRYGGAEGFSSGRYVACFGTIGVIYDTSRPLERRAAPKAQDGSTKRCERLCEAIRLPLVIPTEVEGSFLQTGKPWVRERRKGSTKVSFE